MATFMRTGNRLVLSHCLLVLFVASASALCPNRCNCDESKLAVDCKDGALDLVPITLNPSLSELYLNRNSIKSIASSFTFYRKLQLLDISENAISSLGVSNFHSQNILQVLLVARNKITHVKRDTFTGLGALRILSLAENMIESIDEHAFSEVKFLQKLDLSKNNLNHLSRHTLFGLVNLKVLHLQRNFFKKLPNDALTLVNNLNHLDVSFNLIDGASLLLPSLKQLTELNVEGNKISHLTNDTFANVQQNLLSLNLGYNALESIPSDGIGILTNLQHLTVSGNAISNLNENTLTGLHRLQSFTLTNDDRLKSIHRNTFTPNTLLHSISIDFCPKLTELQVETFVFQRQTIRSVSLRGNGLTSVHSDLFDWNSLETVDIRDNPFDCRCDFTLWLGKFINEHVNVSIQLDHLKEITCHEPRHLRGYQVSSITPNQMNCAIDSAGKSYSSLFSSAYNRSNGYAPAAPSSSSPSSVYRKTYTFIILPVSIVLAVTLAVAIAYTVWIGVRKNRAKRLAEERIKHFLTVNINNFDNNGNGSSNCNTLLINKNFTSQGHRENADKYYSSIASERKRDLTSNSENDSPGTLVNPFECMNLYESPIYHEITSYGGHQSPVSRNQQSTVPLIASSSPFNCTTYINTTHGESTINSEHNSYSSSRKKHFQLKSDERCRSTVRNTNTSNNSTLVSGNSLNVTNASPYAASFVIQHPIKVDSNLYRV